MSLAVVVSVRPGDTLHQQAAPRCGGPCIFPHDTNNIRLDAVSEEYPNGYIEEQLDEVDVEVEPYAGALARKLKF